MTTSNSYPCYLHNLPQIHLLHGTSASAPIQASLSHLAGVTGSYLVSCHHVPYNLVPHQMCVNFF